MGNVALKLSATNKTADRAGVDDPLTPDFDSYPIRHAPVSIELETHGIVISWTDGRTDRFNRYWLRENAVQDGIVDPVTRERELAITELPETLRVVAARIEPSGTIVLSWAPDEMETCHHPGWLRAFADRSWQPSFDLPEHVTWDAAEMPEPPSFDGPTVLRDEATLNDWLVALERFGLARLRGLPVEDGLVQTVAERIGTVRPTNFGLLFTVESKPDPDSTAYTSVALDPHTDLPSRETQPGLQLLLCKKNSCIDGASLMVDGFRVARSIRENDPDAFDALTRLNWLFSNRHRETDYRRVGPVIDCDQNGAAIEIRFANFLRAHPDLPHADIERAYRALRLFMREIQSDRFVCRYAFKPGDLVAFDNRRVLHGRDAFDPRSGERELEGCYLDRDELHSRLRILARRRRSREATSN